MATQHTPPYLAVHTGYELITRQPSLRPTPPFFSFDVCFFKEIWFSTLDYIRITWKSLKTVVPIPHSRTTAGASPLYLPVPPTHMSHVELGLRTTASRSHINKEKAELLGMEKRSFLEGTLGYPPGLFPLSSIFFSDCPWPELSRYVALWALFYSSLLPLGHNIT